MRIAFTFHNLAQSEPLKAYAEEKLSKLQKYLHGPMEASMTFSVERHSFCVDASVHAGSETYQGREEQEDMYAAINLVMDKLRQQISRAYDTHKERRRDAAPLGGE